jgi:hypothetical protein
MREERAGKLSKSSSKGTYNRQMMVPKLLVWIESIEERLASMNGGIVKIFGRRNELDRVGGKNGGRQERRRGGGRGVKEEEWVEVD